MKKLFRISPVRGSRGPVVFAWQPEGNFLATSTSTGLVQIFNRHGDKVSEIPLSGTGEILALDWDKDGSCLAILQDLNGQIPIWELGEMKVSFLETNLRDPTFIKWSKVRSVLRFLFSSFFIYLRA